MPVFLEDKKILLLHIPRTGGNWVLRVVRRANIDSTAWIRSNHSNLTQSHQLLGQLVVRYDHNIEGIFAFVRHPIDYYESVWMYMHSIDSNRDAMKEGCKFRWHPYFHIMESYCPDFRQWVETVIDTIPGWYSQMIDSYVGPKGGEFCQYIGRTERLGTDFVDILMAFGYELTPRQIRTILQYGKANASYARSSGVVKQLLN